MYVHWAFSLIFISCLTAGGVRSYVCFENGVEKAYDSASHICCNGKLHIKTPGKTMCRNNATDQPPSISKLTTEQQGINSQSSKQEGGSRKNNTKTRRRTLRRCIRNWIRGLDPELARGGQWTLNLVITGKLNKP